MYLSSTTQKFQVKLSGAVSATECSCVVNSRTLPAGAARATQSEDPKSQAFSTTGATPVDILAAPVAGFVKFVDELYLYNADSANVTATIQMVDGSSTYILKVVTLASGASLVYSGGRWSDGGITLGAGVDTSITGNLAVTGTSALTGNVTMGGTLGVTGVTTVDVLKQGAANAIAAFATGGQASATALTKFSNRVTVCATNGDSVKLPAATAGRMVHVKNASANTLAIFPASGEVINALSPDASISLATVKSMLFVCSLAGTWDTILTA